MARTTEETAGQVASEGVEKLSGGYGSIDYKVLLWMFERLQTIVEEARIDIADAGWKISTRDSASVTIQHYDIDRNDFSDYNFTTQNIVVNLGGIIEFLKSIKPTERTIGISFDLLDEYKKRAVLQAHIDGTMIRKTGLLDVAGLDLAKVPAIDYRVSVSMAADEVERMLKKWPKDAETVVLDYDGTERKFQLAIFNLENKLIRLEPFTITDYPRYERVTVMLAAYYFKDLLKGAENITISMATDYPIRIDFLDMGIEHAYQVLAPRMPGDTNPTLDEVYTKMAQGVLTSAVAEKVSETMYRATAPYARKMMGKKYRSFIDYITFLAEHVGQGNEPETLLEATEQVIVERGLDSSGNTVDEKIISTSPVQLSGLFNAYVEGLDVLNRTLSAEVLEVVDSMFKTKEYDSPDAPIAPLVKEVDVVVEETPEVPVAPLTERYESISEEVEIPAGPGGNYQVDTPWGESVRFHTSKDVMDWAKKGYLRPEPDVDREGLDKVLDRKGKAYFYSDTHYADRIKVDAQVTKIQS